MALPKIVLRGRKIILLSGFKDEAWDKSTQHRKVVVDAEDKLRQAAKPIPMPARSAMWPASGSLRLEVWALRRANIASRR